MPEVRKPGSVFRNTQIPKIIDWLIEITVDEISAKKSGLKQTVQISIDAVDHKAEIVGIGCKIHAVNIYDEFFTQVVAFDPFFVTLVELL